MSDSDHPSDGATGTGPPIQRSSQFNAVFEQFKGYVVSRLFIYLFIHLKIRTMYRGENNRTRSPLLGSPSNSDPIKCRKTNPLPQKTRIKY